MLLRLTPIRGKQYESAEYASAPHSFRLLASEQVEVIIVGGFAAVALGVPYITQDIDFCYNPTPTNIKQLVRALTPFHPRLRIEGMSDAEARALPFQLDSITLAQSRYSQSPVGCC